MIIIHLVSNYIYIFTFNTAISVRNRVSSEKTLSVFTFLIISLGKFQEVE